MIPSGTAKTAKKNFNPPSASAPSFAGVLFCLKAFSLRRYGKECERE
jgi:hypothetical protein